MPKRKSLQKSKSVEKKASSSKAKSKRDEDKACASQPPPEEELDSDAELEYELSTDEEGNSDAESDNMDKDEEEAAKPRAKVWRLGKDELAPGEQLVHEARAYDMLHKLSLEWPSLSFDVIVTDPTKTRSRYPLSCMLVVGPQTVKSPTSELWVIKASHMCRTKFDREDEDDSEGSDEDEDADDDNDNDDNDDRDPTLELRRLHHNGMVNRLRCMPQKGNIVATWSADGNINIFDVNKEMQELDDPEAAIKAAAAKSIKSAAVGASKNASGGGKGLTKPRRRDALFTSSSSDSHATEGFAVDWSSVEEGRLATGDCNGKMFVWTLAPDGKVATLPLAGHKQSCEDIQWSPMQKDVCASSSVDGSVRVWDVRDPKPLKLLWVADVVDINVLAWNKHASASHLIATGSDSGALKIWDLRKQAEARQKKTSGEVEPVIAFNFHQGPICSLEWSPLNESLLMAAGEDNQVTFWDFSVEADDDDLVAGVGTGADDFPPQLIFQHMGHEQLREVHWHRQLPGLAISTDINGIQFYKPTTWKNMIA